jgi:hypothetical protein
MTCFLNVIDKSMTYVGRACGVECEPRESGSDSLTVVSVPDRVASGRHQ